MVRTAAKYKRLLKSKDYIKRRPAKTTPFKITHGKFNLIITCWCRLRRRGLVDNAIRFSSLKFVSKFCIMRFSIFLSKSFMALLTCDTSIKLHTLTGKGGRLFFIFADEEFEPLAADITIITSKNKTTLKQAANGQRISSTSTLCFSTELFRARTPMTACLPPVLAYLYVQYINLHLLSFAVVYFVCIGQHHDSIGLPDFFPLNFISLGA